MNLNPQIPLNPNHKFDVQSTWRRVAGGPGLRPGQPRHRLWAELRPAAAGAGGQDTPEPP